MTNNSGNQRSLLTIGAVVLVIIVVYRVGAAWYAYAAGDMNSIRNLGCTNGDPSQFAGNLCANDTTSQCQR